MGNEGRARNEDAPDVVEGYPVFYNEIAQCPQSILELLVHEIDEERQVSSGLNTIIFLLDGALHCLQMHLDLKSGMAWEAHI